MRIADRVLAALAEATGERIVVANDPRASDWFPGEPVVADATPGLGPLAGLETALAAARGRGALVVAWDMPFVTGPLLRAIRARGESDGRAAVPVLGAPGRAEPLCAYYGPSALAACRALIAAGERRAAALYEALPGAAAMDEGELARFGDPSRMFASVDTPEALASLGGSLGPQAG
jgi:molybdopterin-guanine dinucleotide biosynthesis protein A